MKSAFRLFARLAVTVFLAAAAASTAFAQADAIASRTSQVNGIEMQYLTPGHGPAVILLHGYTQTSRCGDRLFPAIREIHGDRARPPGIGDRRIPRTGWT